MGHDHLEMGSMKQRIAIVFPGQGSQSVGMADDIVKQSAAAKALFDRAATVLEYDLLKVIHEGPDVVLQDTRVSQPAIFVTNLAFLAAMGDGFHPIAAAGHSFAEYCALTVAGVFTFETALRLVWHRAQAMGRAAERVPGAMSAVLGLEADALRAIVAETVADDPQTQVSLANFNAPTQIVISGDRRGIEAVGARAAAAGAKRVVPLNVSGAWHSPLMEPARTEFKEVLAAAEFSPPTFPVVSNVDAKIYTEVEQIRINLIRSLTDEVLWHDAALELLRQKPDLVIEFGAGRVLASLMKRLPDAPEIRHAGDGKSVNELRESLGEVLENA
jgi:[acyl-carrier-protein] S-malonyltransferase